MDELHQKYQALKDNLKALGGAVIAFSSGVDSTFLLKTANDVLGDRCMAVTARARSFPRRELVEAEQFCRQHGIRHTIIDFEELKVEGFAQNPKNRCYLCKRELFTKILNAAGENNIPYVAEGSNTDDNGDYRPGLTAVAELGIKSPLREANLTKSEIRQLSRELDLPTWDKQSFACLSSRFVYGETITEEKLTMVDKAEQRLLDLGFHQVRVRIHGTIARIEVDPSELPKVLDSAPDLNAYFQQLGFTYVTLDLGGYKMGSMNKTL